MVITPRHDYYPLTPQAQEQVPWFLRRWITPREHPGRNVVSYLFLFLFNYSTPLYPYLHGPTVVISLHYLLKNGIRSHFFESQILTVGALHQADSIALQNAAFSWQAKLAPLLKPLLVVNIGGPTSNPATHILPLPLY